MTVGAQNTGRLVDVPYVLQQIRDELEAEGGYPVTPGELNYAITKLIVDYFDRTKPDYAGINEVIGVLECAKLELYRRVAAPYEDTKCAENGDVYPS